MSRLAFRRLAFGVGASMFAFGVIIGLADPTLFAPGKAIVAGGLALPAAARN